MRLKRNLLEIITSVLWSLILAAGIVYLVAEESKYKDNKPDNIPISEFQELVEDGAVDLIFLPKENNMSLRFTYKGNENLVDKAIEERTKYNYKKEEWGETTYPNTNEFRNWLIDNDVYIVQKSFDSPMTSLVTNAGAFVSIAIMVFMVTLLMRMMLQMSGGTNYQAFDSTSKDSLKATFNDVIGHDEVIADLRVIQKLFKDPKLGEATGAVVPKGILFTGAPGTGKTLLAEAMAKEMGVNYYYANASSFIELYVGMGAKRVRSLFKTARKHTPCIIFIDEIDAIGEKRTFDSNSERQQTINALLQEMDGFLKDSGILVIAATNKSDGLDPALLRSGRFDREIIVRPPKDWHVREELLRYYLKDRKISDDCSYEALAKKTAGFTGADIKAFVNQAALIAVERGNTEAMTSDDFQLALEKKVLKGSRRTADHEERDKLVCACHEAGHALVTYLSKLPIVQVSIVQTTSGVGGYVMHEDGETQLYSKEEVGWRIRIAYGGRCAEVLKNGAENATIGASSDIQGATELLKQYVCTYGFDEELGCVVVDPDDEQVKKRVSTLAKKFEGETMDLLTKYKDVHELFMNKLYEEEVISGVDAEKFFAMHIDKQ